MTSHLRGGMDWPEPDESQFGPRVSMTKTPEEIVKSKKWVSDLTTKTRKAHEDAEALADRPPRVDEVVPGYECLGQVGTSQAVLRFPQPEQWNGKLVVGATPALRSSQSLDWLVSDLVLQRGYAYAASDKGTPGLVLRDPNRQMTEWVDNYQLLTGLAQETCDALYHHPVARTYVTGVSNGGYLTRRLLECFPELFDGGVEWEGVFWHPESNHLLVTLPVMVKYYPVFRNFHGDATRREQGLAYSKLLEAGLNSDSSPYWNTYYSVYWIISLWLYGRNLDPSWEPFAEPWSDSWLRNPEDLANYPRLERKEVVAARMKSIANTGLLRRPLLSVAGNWDCLLPYRFHAKAYSDLVAQVNAAAYHRLYEIERGNHVDGLLRVDRGQQQPVLPYFEAAFRHLENWVENEIEPPNSGRFSHIQELYPRKFGSLYSKQIGSEH